MGSATNLPERLVGLYVAALAVRLALFAIPGLPETLTGRVEISTPMTSFKRLQEGAFLWRHNGDVYAGGVYHQAPLLLLLGYLSPPSSSSSYAAVASVASHLASCLVYSAADIASAAAVGRLAASSEASNARLYRSPRAVFSASTATTTSSTAVAAEATTDKLNDTLPSSQKSSSSSLLPLLKRHRRWSPLAVAAMFLFNPFTVASCVARSSAVFTSCAILRALAAAVDSRPDVAMACLALATYLSMYPVLLLPPLLLLCWDRCQRRLQQQQQWKKEEKVKEKEKEEHDLQKMRTQQVHKARARSEHRLVDHVPLPLLPSFAFVMQNVGLFTATLLGLLGLSWALTGFSWAFLDATYGEQLRFSDLTPNIGLWWYFFVEMFDSFRPFFLAVFWLHLAAYVGGLTVRLRRQPLAVIVILLGIFAIFKPYPTIADAALFFAVVPLYRHVFPLLRYGFLEGASVLYSCTLGPAFYHLWIYAGSGNANFFYAITLVWSLGLSLMVSDLTWAVLRDEWESEHPEMVGKEIRQIS